MTREEQIRKDSVDRLDAAISESRRLGRESRDLENTHLPLRREAMLRTIAAQESRIQELVDTLDTATRLRMLRDDEPRTRPETDRRKRS